MKRIIINVILIFMSIVALGQKKAIIYQGKVIVFSSSVVVDTEDTTTMQLISCDSIVPCDAIIPCNSQYTSEVLDIELKIYKIKYFKHEEILTV